MPEATASQVQATSDKIIRPLAQEFRALVANCNAIKNGIADVYTACNDSNFVWTDNRTDGPMHLNGKQDMLVANAVVNLFLNFCAGTATLTDSQNFAANYPVFQQSCVTLPDQPINIP